MTVAAVVFVAFAIGWMLGKRTGFEDGRRAGHYEMAALFEDVRKMQKQLNDHTWG